jgi:predicted deacylase
MASSPGSQRHLKVHRIGREDTRPKVYLQAALHANETPGLLILHHFLAMALEADRQDRVLGELVVVPYANPIGLADNVLGTQIGRDALDGSGNFNRGFPDLGALVKARLPCGLGPDSAANVSAVRAELGAVLQDVRPRTELQDLQTTLLKLAVDADFVFDLHSELEAVLAVVMAPWALAPLRDFVADLQPQAVLLADTPPLFDTVCSRPWHDLAQHLGPEVPLPPACVGATLELRGVADVDDAQAREDAERIFRFLQRCGAVAGDPGPVPPWRCEPTPPGAVEFVRAPAAGVVAYRQPLGARVPAGAVVA